MHVCVCGGGVVFVCFSFLLLLLLFYFVFSAVERLSHEKGPQK